MPSCLRANVNQQDKPSEGVMGLTTDDPSALHYHSVAFIVCWTTGSRRKRVEIQQRTHGSPSFWCWEGNDARSGHLLLLSSSYLWSREIRGNSPGMWESKKWVNVKNIVHLSFLSLTRKILEQALESCCLGEDAGLTKCPSSSSGVLCPVSLTCKKKRHHYQITDCVCAGRGSQNWFIALVQLSASGKCVA